MLHDASTAGVATALAGEGVIAAEVATEVPAPTRRWSTVLLTVADVASLRRAVPLLPGLGRTRTVACWLAEAEGPLLAAVRAEWPPLASTSARALPTGSALTSFRFSRPVAAKAVLDELARAGGTRRRGNPSGLVMATAAATPRAFAPADTALLVSVDATEVADPTLAVPPDVVVTDRPLEALPLQPVIGRRPLVVAEVDLGPPPLDEGVLNPAGFLRDTVGGPVDLGHDGTGLTLRGADLAIDLDAARGTTAAVVRALRARRGVRVRWSPVVAPETARVVAGLAIAGVPLVGDAVPPAAADLLGPALTQLLSLDVDLDLPLPREEHSVRLRRAALATHSTLAWLHRISRSAGSAAGLLPQVSVVLATKRPQQLDFALRQVARQRGVDAELVLVCHGFTVDEGLVRSRLPGKSVVVVEVPESLPFGDVLNAGVRAAGHDLLVKMDDDDWYGPDFLSDLLWARHYSGADLVGMTPDFVYLEELDTTLRRHDDSERPAKFVAGGTMLLERSFLTAVGGFRPVTRFVDAQLLAATHAVGGTVYRTHGLGYTYRRSRQGHTWDPGLDYFLDPSRVTDRWPGFSPSRLLTYDPADAPKGGPP
ncbi:glycosyltransferase [Nocardioides immobilis]|uniref:Glycosyltransferase n=1 Tax=Nocardioides immobilis TaxID=2049295 RepID=A0A417Y598_9ACTN|nr:glycosyltransferase [Nocardioides immobilis]